MARSRVKFRIRFPFITIVPTKQYMCYSDHLPEPCNSYIDEGIEEINYFLSHVVQTLVQVVLAFESAIPNLCQKSIKRVMNQGKYCLVSKF
jgi:hypothetical protein